MVLLAGLLLFLMLGGFGSRADSNHYESRKGRMESSGTQQIYPFASQTPTKRNETEAKKTDSHQARQDEQGEEDGNDPDLPAFAKGKIDGADYIRRREEYIARLRGWEADKPFDPSARGRAIEQMEQEEAQRSGKGTLLGTLESMLGFTPAAGLAWTELGPHPIPNGPTSPANPVSGRVSAIEIDPIDPSKVYVGAAQGGVYRSLDGGMTWTPIFDSAQSLAIGSLTLDATNGRLWVGTGEANGSVDSYAGVGLYRIENVNTSADLFGPINPVRNYFDNNGISRSAPAFNGRSISKILIVPNDPTTLLVGAAGGVIGIGGSPPLGNSIPPLGMRGLYKLTNAIGAPATVGVTRIAVSPNAAAGGCFDSPCTGNRNVSDMVYDLSDPSGNTLIVWLNGVGATNAMPPVPIPNDGGIYRSTNVLSGSPTFTQTLVTTAASTGNGRGVFAVAQKAPSPALIYVASGEPSTGGTLCNSSSNPGALRRSTDGGVTWSTELPGGGGFCSTAGSNQCFYNIGIDLVPGATTASDKILLGGSIHSNGICTRMEGTSADGAATTFSNTDGGLHADTHVIKIAPSDPSIVYRGDDGGIWKSIDGGSTWSSLNNSTFRATQFQSIAVHPIDGNYTIGGTQDNGTEFLAPDGTTWIFSDGGDGGYALIDQSSPDTTSVTAYHTYSNSSGSRIEFARATSTVSPGDPFWDKIFGCGGTANGISCSDAVNFYAPMALGPGGSGNPNTVYFGSDRLYRSGDKGTTMSLVSQGPLVSSVPISAVGISPQDDNYRIVGLNNGALFYTTTGSTTLTSLDPTGGGSVIPDFYVARVVFDPNPANNNTAYISLGNYSGGTAASQSHVWKVTSLNTTPVLAAINGTGGNILPDVPVNGFAVDPTNSSNLFAGTDIGVYNSTDGGANWAPYGTGLPRVAVFDMAIQNPSRILRIATHGRGMWEISIAGTTPTIQFSLSNYSVNKGDGHATITVNRTGDMSGSATVDYRTTDTDTFTLNCADPAKHGSAYARCDYATTLGTLTFAAGEASKTFSIPIINDSYADGNETFSVVLSNPTGASLGSPATATVTIINNDTVNGTNPMLLTNDAGIAFFVRQHYLDFLGREPEAGEPWSAILRNCSNQFNTDPNSPSAACDRITVSGAFFGSPEFKDKGIYLIDFYRVAFNRLPQYAEFSPDLASLAGSTAAEANAKRAAFANNFVLRTEFVNTYAAMTNSTYVTTLMSHMGQYNLTSITTPDPANPDGTTKVTLTTNDLINRLNGVGGTLTRAQVLRAIVQSDEVTLNFEAVNAFVASQYYGYLRRTPDTSGFNSWVNYLGAHPSDFRTMVNGFVNSIEYRLRFGPS